MTDSALSVLIINATLKPSPEASSTELLGTQLLEQFALHNVHGEIARAVDLTLAPGVETDMGGSDEWPQLREKILAADIVAFCSPTWVGQMSSVMQRILERLDAELSVTDDAGRPILFHKVAVTGVVGNEDGAHKITADLHQALNDVGFTVPAQGGTYWNGRAMEKVDYKDLSETPEAVRSANATLARNAAHLAGALRSAPYPPEKSE
ncbi:flavodoxin family protein [Microterricola pindariensis]|uniref:Flavodoxin n=1 Tax=Microterricola pindariensis TaxID=478010 RepID=A0ABX5AUC2_9MICO|nr:NAD(P)H-dependent oxidoreductase [Microterricola pindariensis]PPL17644.1 flavodoxin [Microterricola pindariensis]